jgi:formylglycine-generating enzyme required for sulfatase activity
MQPNAWGLYDTLGNVWEWVQSFYNEKTFADPPDPSVLPKKRPGLRHDSTAVLRGDSSWWLRPASTSA